MSIIGMIYLVVMVGTLLIYLILFCSLTSNPRRSLSPYVLTGTTDPDAFSDRVPTVSALIPARNEERNIRSCLSALLRQDFPNLEIIVIDDQSTDNTAAVVREFQEQSKAITLINGQELPPGWMGKNHALYQGFQEAGGEYLLFLDADARLTSPQCITQTVRCAIEQDIDLLTLVPHLECKSFWEKVVLPILGFFVMNRFVLKKINDSSSKITSVVGPYLLFRRQTYEAIGGHEQVKGEIVEDLVLAQTIKNRGYRLGYLLGTELFALRLYRDLHGIWEGFSKNFFAGMEQKIWVAIACIFIMFSVLVLPWLSFPIGLAYMIFYGWNELAIASLVLGAIPCLITVIIRRLLKAAGDLDDTYSWLQPLGGLVLIGILTNSIVRVIFGKGVSWKGRVYLES